MPISITYITRRWKPHSSRFVWRGTRKTAPDFLFCEQNVLKADRILKKYLPATRPPDWSWRLNQRKFDFFLNEENLSSVPYQDIRKALGL